MQFSTLFLISLFSVSLVLSGCVGSDNDTGSSNSGQSQENGDGSTPEDNKDEEGSDNTDGENTGGEDNGSTDDNTDGSNDGDGSNSITPPDYIDSKLENCEYLPTAFNDPNLSLSNTNNESTYDFTNYNQITNVDATQDLTGTWVMINKKSNFLGDEYDITQIWEKTFFIIREAENFPEFNSQEYEISSCSTKGFLPVYLEENNILAEADITPMFGNVKFKKSSNTELVEAEPDGLSAGEKIIFNKNRAKAFKISQSTSSLSNGNNKVEIGGAEYNNGSVWCINQARKVSNIKKQNKSCSVTTNSQLTLSVRTSSAELSISRDDPTDKYSFGKFKVTAIENQLTTLQSSTEKGGIIKGQKAIMNTNVKTLLNPTEEDEAKGRDREVIKDEPQLNNDFVLVVQDKPPHKFECNKKEILINSSGVDDSFKFSDCSADGLGLNSYKKGKLDINVSIP